MTRFATPSTLAVFALAGTLGLAACTDQPVQPITPSASSAHSAAASTNGRYLVLFTGNDVPADFASRVRGLGGSVAFADGRIGVAAVENLTAEAAASLGAGAGIQGIAPDRQEERAAPATAPSNAEPSDPASAADPTSAQYYGRQWNMRAIGADRAWAAGHTGSRDVTVAILDSGIDPTHPDLVGLVDASRSTSFAPAEDSALAAQHFPGAPVWTDLDGSGTHAAATVSSNAVLTAGVSSNVTLMAVKVSGFNGTRWSSVVQGIMYAADHDADVIDLSMAFRFPHNNGAESIALSVTRAVNYAYRQGATVVVPAGDNTRDLDRDGSSYDGLCSAPGVICVSATGPTSAGPTTGPTAYTGPFENTDTLASYSNFGRSAISVAAPGGNLVFGTTPQGWPALVSASWVWGACSRTKLWSDWFTGEVEKVSCGPVEIVGYANTSRAASHVSGLAALLVGKYGHDNPAQIRAAILQSADDLGQPGVDPAYGHGRINVARALGLQ